MVFHHLFNPLLSHHPHHLNLLMRISKEVLCHRTHSSFRTFNEVLPFHFVVAPLSAANLVIVMTDGRPPEEVRFIDESACSILDASYKP